MLARISLVILILSLAYFLFDWFVGAREGYGLREFGLRQPPPQTRQEADSSAEQGELSNASSVTSDQLDFEGTPYTIAKGARMSPSEVHSLAQINREMSEIVKRVKPSVVAVFSAFYQEPQPYQMQLMSRAIGSGSIVTEEGHVITNYHVISGMNDIRIRTHTRKTYPAKLLGADEYLDIAILKIEGTQEKFVPLPFGDSDQVEVGHQVLSVGSPFGLTESVTSGMINARQRRFSEAKNPLFQTDAVMNQGNSGGPLLNIYGEMIGVNAAYYVGSDSTNHAESGKSWQGIGLAIPSNDVRNAFESILRRGRIVTSWIGLSMDLPLDNSTNVDSLFITRVEPGSPADKTGLKKGDRVLEFAGAEVISGSDFLRMVQQTPPGKPTPIKFLREGKVYESKVTLEEKKGLLEMSAPGSDAGQFAAAENQTAESVLGIRVRDLTGLERRDVMPGLGWLGILIQHVEKDSPLSAYVNPGDMIFGITNDQGEAKGIISRDGFHQIFNQLPLNRPVTLRVISADGRVYGVRFVPVSDS